MVPNEQLGSIVSALNEATRVVVWHPKLVSGEYCGPVYNFRRLFDEVSPDIKFHLLGYSTSCQALKENEECIGRSLKEGRDPSSRMVPIIQVCAWLIVNRKRYDVYYGLTSFMFSLIPAIICKLLGKRAIVRPAGLYDYSASPDDHLGWGKRIIKRYMFRAISGVVAIHSGVRDACTAYGLAPEKICWSPNSVDTTRFAPTATEQCVSSKLKILHVGGLTRRKRLHVLLRAVANLVTEGYPIDVVSVGPNDDDEYLGMIRSEIDARGLQSIFQWKGVIDDIETVYRQSNIFCLPTSAEGMPNALLEAMASGLPVITTRLPGTCDVVRDGVEGFIIEQFPDSDLAGAIEKVIKRYFDEPGLLTEQGCAARKRIVESFEKTRCRRAIELFLTAQE